MPKHGDGEDPTVFNLPPAEEDDWGGLPRSRDAAPPRHYGSTFRYQPQPMRRGSKIAIVLGVAASIGLAILWFVQK